MASARERERVLTLSERMARLGEQERSALAAVMNAQGVRLEDLPRARLASILIVDPDLRIVHAEGPSFEAPGFRAADLAGQPVATIMAEEDREWLMARYEAARAGEPQFFDLFARVNEHVYFTQLAPLGVAGPEAGWVIAIVQDTTDQVRTTVELLRSDTRLADAERMVGLGTWELASGGTLTYSDGFARATGLPAGDRRTLDDLLARVDPGDRDALAGRIARCTPGGSASLEVRIGARTFEVWFEARDRHVRGALLDVTDERASERERTEAVSLFREAFDAAPVGMGLHDPETDRHVRVNRALCDLLGRTAEELTGVSMQDIVHADDRPRLEEARRRILAGELDRFHTDVRSLRGDGRTTWTALSLAPVRDAEGAIRVLFSQSVDISEHKRREERMRREVDQAQWLGRIRDALDEDRFELYAQPIVDLRTGETVQRELLIRMRDEDGSVIAPGAFLPAAERYGLITEIDRWVMRQAVALAATGVACEFNLSGASIEDRSFLDDMTRVLAESGADPSLLVVEITETTLVEEREAGRRFAEAVSALGCGLALDDFGTGFASLSYLKHIPASHLKIDMEFVRDITRSEDDERVVQGIVGLARAFGQASVAEGIEDEDTLLRVRALGVDLGQGYLFGRPQPLGAPAQAEPASARRSPGLADPVAGARELFAVVAGRDPERTVAATHPECVIRPYETMAILGRTEPYRGHAGVREYLADVASLWEDLTLEPIAFRATGGAVIAFGRLVGVRRSETVTADMLWVLRFRDGRIASFDAVLDESGDART